MSIRFSAGTQDLRRTANLPDDIAFSVCGWGRLSADNNDFSNIMSLESTTGGGATGVYLQTLADGVTLSVGATGLDYSNVATLAVGADFFWGFTSSALTNASNIAYYRTASANTVTAVPIADASPSSRPAFAPGVIWFAQDSFAEPFNGRLWNIKCWDRALTAKEMLVESFYQRVMYPTSINFHWWLKNANDTIDRSGNGRNATKTGTPTTEGELALWVPRRQIFIMSPAAGGGVTTKTMTDTAALIDEAIESLRRVRQQSDSTTAGDELIYGARRGNVTSDGILMGDATVSGARRGVTASESLSVTDDFIDFARRTRQMSDAATVADGFVSWRQLARVSQDNLDLLDGFSRSVIGAGTVYARVVSDALVASDQIVDWVHFKRVMADNADLLDGFTKTLIGVGIVYAKVMSDTTTLIDDSGQRWTLRTSRLSDALGLSDAVLRALARIRIMGEDIEFSDGAIRFLRAVRVPTDPLDISDELVRTFFADQIFTVAIVFGARESFRMSTYDPMVFSAAEPSHRFGGH